MATTSMIYIEGLGTLKKAFRHKSKVLSASLRQGLIDSGNFLKEKSNQIAPEEDKDLINESFVYINRVNSKQVQVTVGYGPYGGESRDYAVPQHDFGIYKKKKIEGRKWKFLEAPYRRYQKKMVKQIGEEVSKGIRK